MICRDADVFVPVGQGKFSNAEIQTVFENSETARQGALAIFVDLARDIAAGLVVDAAWQLDLIDETGKPVFEIAAVAKEAAALIPRKMRRPCRIEALSGECWPDAGLFEFPWCEGCPRSSAGKIRPGEDPMKSAIWRGWIDGIAGIKK